MARSWRVAVPAIPGTIDQCAVRRSLSHIVLFSALLMRKQLEIDIEGRLIQQK
jgi:hypothetical protein